MKKLSKKTLAWLLSLMLMVTMTTTISFAAEPEDADGVNEPVATEEQQLEEDVVNEATEDEVFAVEEPLDQIGDEEGEGEEPGETPELNGSFKLVDLEGNEQTITFEQIVAAGATEVSADNPWKYNGTVEAYGTFYSFKKVLETAGVDYSDAHGLKVVATDGFTSGNSQAEIDKMYIYDMSQVTKGGKVAGEAGKLALAIEDYEGTTAGNRWGNDIATVSLAADHVWFVKKGSCKHYCSICNEDEPSITLQAGDQEITIHDCEIRAAGAEEVTADNPWKFNTDKECYGTFYSLKKVLETAGVDYSEAHGLKVVATDGFTSGVSQAEIDNLYIFDMSEVNRAGSYGTKGTYGLGIKDYEGTTAGNRWANDVATISVADDHVWFVKKGSCKHYCTICNEDEPSITIKTGDTEVAVHNCEIISATSVEVTADAPWTGGKNKYTGTFYSLKSILETAGIDASDCHGIITKAGDGFTNGFESIDDVYVYDQGEVLKNGSPAGDKYTYGTAVNGAAGNKWAKGIVSVEVAATHLPFHKGDKDYSYCAICGEELFDIEGELVSLEDMVRDGADGVTVKINRDVDYGDVPVELNADGKTVTVDLDGNTLTGGIKAIGGNIIVDNGTVKGQLTAADGATIKAAGGFYDYELPEANLVEGKVPVYANGMYEVKTVSAYASQALANTLQQQIDELSDTINQLTATIMLGDVTVTVEAKQVAYNEVSVAWEADQDVAGFKVQKKVNGEWTDVEVTGSKLEEAAEPGIANDYRVAAQVEYDTTAGKQMQAGKYVSASVTTSLDKAAVSKFTTKSKKLTAKWSAVAGADSYDVWIGTNSAVTKGLVKYNNVKGLSKTSKALKKGKKYYVKVRARVTNSEGKVVYGAWSAAKSVKCK